MAYNNPNESLFVTLAFLGLFLVGSVICIGPQAITTSVSARYASGYGADWYVVQYAQSGCVMHTWDLKATAVHNEGESDGIYFLDGGGAVVHLSGHYVYVQDASKKLREDLTGVGRCSEAVQ